MRTQDQVSQSGGPCRRNVLAAVMVLRSWHPLRGARPSDAVFRWSFPLSSNDHRLLIRLKSEGFFSSTLERQNAPLL